MNPNIRSTLQRQFGAAIDMLENAIRACPDAVWTEPRGRREFWYVAYHTLFFLDYYLTDSVEGFRPPAPFTLDEFDPNEVLPPQPYSKDQLLTYLEHGRRKCRTTIDTMTDAQARRRRAFPWGEVDGFELLLYNMRHVQHHAAQLNLMLRQAMDAAPRWVAGVPRPSNGA